MSLEDLTPQERAYLSAGKLLFENPEVSGDAKRLLIKAKPEARANFPDIQLQDKFAEQQAALDKRQKEIDEKLAKDELDRRVERQRATLREQGVDVEALETFMKENELYSYEKAAKIFKQVNQTAAATPASLVKSMQANADAEVKAFWKDPIKAARDEAAKAIEEMRGRRTTA